MTSCLFQHYTPKQEAVPVKEHLPKRHQDLFTSNVSSASVKAVIVRSLSRSRKTPAFASSSAGIQKLASQLLPLQGRFVRSLLHCLFFVCCFFLCRSSFAVTPKQPQRVSKVQGHFMPSTLGDPHAIPRTWGHVFQCQQSSSAFLLHIRCSTSAVWFGGEFFSSVVAVTL